MKKINFSFVSRIKNNAFVISFSFFIIVASLFWGIIYAEGIASNIAPKTPARIQYKASNVSVALYWTDSSHNEDSFKIERKLSDTNVWLSYAVAGSPNITYYLDTNITPGNSYDYRIQACLRLECSPYLVLEKVVIPTSTTINTGYSLFSTPASTSRPASTPAPASTPLASTSIANTDIQNTTTQGSSNASGSNTVSGSSPSLGDVNNKIEEKTKEEKTKEEKVKEEKLKEDKLKEEKLTEEKVKEEKLKEEKAKEEFSSKTENLGLLIEERKIAIDKTKEELVKIINKEAEDVVQNNKLKEEQAKEQKLKEEKIKEEQAKEQKLKEQKISEEKINVLRDDILKKVDSSLSKSTDITSKDINDLKKDINNDINNLQLTNNKDKEISNTNETSKKEIVSKLDELSELINNQAISFREKDGRLLYKDSNKDGISDYDSIYLFNIDPILPTPISIYEGKSINAAEKILLGFDPTKTELVKIETEKPEDSTAKVLSTYKVKKVDLTEEKEVVFSGQALPNSYVTLYIYSTPIVVTVKTDNNGEWRYILDKELENGEHTVYVATVNNSGSIVAKSSPYLFTKTAEAVTFRDASVAEVYVDQNKPGLLKGDVVIYVVILIIMIILTLFGISISRKEKIQ